MTGNVVIVGAPRSGTNILRDVLSAADGFATWPCDEIPMIWRHGNRDLTHDEIAAESATPEVIGFVRHEFSKIGKRYDAHTVVEKTCATSLRLPFVHRILPDAKYIFIRRDGVDAAVSAAKRWRAEFNLKYTARKVRFIPPSDVPYYAARAAKSLLSRGGDSVGPTLEADWWGPKPADWRELAAKYGELEMAFLQWKRCVDATLTALESFPSDQVHEVVYEDFVVDPQASTRRILEFLGHGDLMRAELTADVSIASVNKGRRLLTAQELDRLEQLADDTLSRLGYA